MTNIPSVDYLWTDETATMKTIRIEIEPLPLIRFTKMEIAIFSGLVAIFFAALFTFASVSATRGYHQMDLKQQEVMHVARS